MVRTIPKEKWQQKLKNPIVQPKTTKQTTQIIRTPTSNKTSTTTKTTIPYTQISIKIQTTPPIQPKILTTTTNKPN